MTVRMLYVLGAASLRAFIHLLGPRPPGPPGRVAVYAAAQRNGAQRRWARSPNDRPESGRRNAGEPRLPQTPRLVRQPNLALER